MNTFVGCSYILLENCISWDSKMEELMDRARRVIEHFAIEKKDFLDVRFFLGEATTINIRNGTAEHISSESNIGAALRALIGGAWGFSTTKSFEEKDLLAAMETAVSAARAMKKYIGESGTVPDKYVYKGVAPLKVRTDPREIALEDKIKVAVELEKNIRKDERIKVSQASLTDIVQREVIVNSLGTEVDVSNCYVRVGGNAVAREGTLIQNASDSVGTSRGWETVEEVDPAELGTRVGDRAVALLSALSPPSGRMNLIMDPTLVGVFIHEAFGHAAEADGVLGNMSVLRGKIGKQVGVLGVTVIDDPTMEGLRGSFPYDSEGTKTRRRVIVKDGILREYYQSLETAAKMGAEPNGAGRAMDFNFKPIPRMGNTFIEGRDMSFEELCQEVKEGVYLVKSYGGYVNPAIGQFYFTAQEGYLIKDGEVGPLTQNVSMSGLTLEVLSNIIGIGKEVKMAFPGTCGKAGQSAPVSGGGPHLAVANVVVGGR